jgi:hypothetical protein
MGPVLNYTELSRIVPKTIPPFHHIILEQMVIKLVWLLKGYKAKELV